MVRLVLDMLRYVFWYGWKAGWCLRRHSKYWIIVPQSEHARKLICCKCGVKFGMHDGLKTIYPMTDADEREMDEMYELIDKIKEGT